jgi:hypothetical protein
MRTISGGDDIAALLLATGAAGEARADTLPKEMLGEWCKRAGRDLIYERGTCDRATRLRVKRNRLDGRAGPEDYGCDFKKITRLPNGSYFVHAECGGEGGVGNEDYIFQIEDKQLKIIIITIRFCVAVIEPAPNVVQDDPEFDPKGWLGLREKPDGQSKITFRLGDGEHLEADAIKGDWTHISNVIRLSGPNGGKIVQGWVRSKYVKRAGKVEHCYE